MKITTLENGNVGLDLGITMEELEAIRVSQLEYGFTPLKIQFPEVRILGLMTSFNGNELPYIFSIPKGIANEEEMGIKSSRLRNLP